MITYEFSNTNERDEEYQKFLLFLRNYNERTI